MDRQSRYCWDKQQTKIHISENCMQYSSFNTNNIKIHKLFFKFAFTISGIENTYTISLNILAICQSSFVNMHIIICRICEE